MRIGHRHRRRTFGPIGRSVPVASLWRRCVNMGHEQSELSRRQKPSSTRALEPLSAAEASQLLRTHQLGRLVFVYESCPVVMPVNYVFEDPTVVIRTDLGAKLIAAPFHAVAFEIDEADPSGR